ncbi:hypothetical protein [Micromonospora sp. NBS 11-29]|uniref:hypothetical protein n=1 Tax=Micromonospora sp. NBS 11-29 TaxID=1960879 RepID=UPI0015932C4E|nr:hypothetical protein [Micromonospora sp. NBS 11-29]
MSVQQTIKEAWMRERPYVGPLPGTHPVPGARPPHPDGDRVLPDPPRPERPALPRRQYLYGVTVALLVLGLLVAGLLR